MPCRGSTKDDYCLTKRKIISLLKPSGDFLEGSFFRALSSSGNLNRLGQEIKFKYPENSFAAIEYISENVVIHFIVPYMSHGVYCVVNRATLLGG